MGRELKRKEAKKAGKNVKKAVELNKEKPMTIKGLVTILVVLILVFGITYLLAGIFATKDIKLFSKSTKEEEETTSSINNRILASDSLKQLEESYYVYYYDSTNEDSEVTEVVDNLEGTVYRVDLHDDFNSNFIGEPSGVVEAIEDLKVSDPTVIKVSSEKIDTFYSGKDEIKASLK